MSGQNPSATSPPIDRPMSADESSSNPTDSTNARTVRVKLGPSIAVEDGPFRDPAPAPMLLTNLLPSLPGYELIEELGTGGNGVVYKAKHISLGRIVAVKTHFSGAFVDPEHLNRLRNEAQALAKLQHPNIVQIYEVGEDSGRPYLALEYCRGGTLSRKLDGTPWEPIRAATLVATLADAVQAAHSAGVIHRDLKPGNILLQIEENRVASSKIKPGDAPLRRGAETADITNRSNAIPKISDFGLARPCDGPTGMTTAGVALGTPSYMPPEQARGELEKLGPLVDVYALGAVLYELLTGRPPFLGHNDYETVHQVIHQEPTSPRTWLPGLPRDLETICLKCLQKNPAARYASAQDLAADLLRFVQGEPVNARPIGIVTRAGRWAKRRPAAAGLIAVSILAGVLAVGMAGMLSYWLQDSERQRAESERLRGIAIAAEERSTQLRAKAEKSAAQTRSALDDMVSEQSLAWLTTQIALLQPQREFLERALKYYAEMAAEEGTEASQTAHIAALFKVALILEALGRPDECIQAYDRAIAAVQEMVRRHPDQPNYASQLAKCWINRAIVHRGQGRIADAEFGYRQGIATLEPLVQKYPNQGDFQLDYGKGLSNLAGLMRDYYRDDRQTEALTRKSMEIFSALIKKQPNHEDAFGCMANNYTITAIMHQNRGQFAEAEKDCNQARAIFEELVRRYPTMPMHRSSLAAILVVASHIASDMGRREEAETMAQRAVDLRETLSREHPSAPIYRQDLSGSLNNLAIIQNDRGKLRECEINYLRSAQIREALGRERPWTAADRSSQGGCYTNLGILYEQIGQRDLAEQYLRRGVAMREELVKDPKIADSYRIELAQSLYWFANFLAAKAADQEAELAYLRTDALYQSLCNKYPENRSLQLSRGGNCCNTGNLFQIRGDESTAHQWYQSAVDHLQAVYDRDPKWPSAQSYLCNSLFGRATTHIALQRPREALVDLERCERLDTGNKKQLILRYRAPALAQTGDFDRAGQLADELAALKPPTKENLLAAARTWATIAAAKNNEAAAIKAVDTLKQALSLTPKSDFLSNSEFDTLRDRPDFQALRGEDSKSDVIRQGP